MTRTETIKLLGLLNVSGLIGAPDAAVFNSTVSVYADLLKDVPFAVAQQAVRDHLGDTRASSGADPRPIGQWWPAPAALLQRVEKQDEPRLLGEWAKVTKLVSAGQPFDPSPAMHRAIEACGGSWEIRMRPADDAKMRSTFVRAYREGEAAAPKQIEGGGT